METMPPMKMTVVFCLLVLIPLGAEAGATMIQYCNQSTEKPTFKYGFCPRPGQPASWTNCCYNKDGCCPGRSVVFCNDPVHFGKDFYCPQPNLADSMGLCCYSTIRDGDNVKYLPGCCSLPGLSGWIIGVVVVVGLTLIAVIIYLFCTHCGSCWLAKRRKRAEYVAHA